MLTTMLVLLMAPRIQVGGSWSLHMLCRPYFATCIQRWDMTHSCVGHDSSGHDPFICGTWLIVLLHICHYALRGARWPIHVWDMTNSYVGHDIFFTWDMYVCDATHYCVWHDSFMCWRVVWLDMWHDALLSGTWPIHLSDTNHSLICVTWLIYMWDMTHSCVGHDSFIWVTWLIHTLHKTILCVCR